VKVTFVREMRSNTGGETMEKSLILIKQKSLICCCSNSTLPSHMLTSIHNQRNNDTVRETLFSITWTNNQYQTQKAENYWEGGKFSSWIN